jgi:rod shape-determining protein MreC
MSVLHRQSRISAQIKGKYYFGSLIWNGADTRTFNLEDVPKFAPAAKGDTIETSGYSSIFPPGIMLGTIKNIWMEPGSNFYSIEVKYSLELANIHYVQIIKNFHKEEQDSLLQSVFKEDE